MLYSYEYKLNDTFDKLQTKNDNIPISCVLPKNDKLNTFINFLQMSSKLNSVDQTADTHLNCRHNLPVNQYDAFYQIISKIAVKSIKSKTKSADKPFGCSSNN